MLPHNRRWLALAGAAIVMSAPPAALAQVSLDLPAVLQRAQGDAPSVRAADAALAAARGRARQAGLPPNPEARLQVEGAEGSGPYRAFQSAETTLSLTQTLELGGKRQRRLGAAEAEVRVAELKRAVALADLRRAVLERYADAWGAQERLGLADEATRRAEDLEAAARALVDAGKEPPLRGLRARGALAQAKAERQAAVAEAASAQAALGALWADPQPNYRLARPVTPETQEASPGDVLDVQLAEAELAAARLGIDRERSLAAPDLTVEAGVRHYADTDDHAYVVGFSAPLPIRNRNQGGAEAARADALAAEVHRNEALAAALRSERDAKTQVAAAEAQVAALEETAAPDAERALSLARLGYQAGKFNLLDVLDANAALAATRTAAIQARVARIKAQAALIRAQAR